MKESGIFKANKYQTNVKVLRGLIQTLNVCFQKF